MPSPPPEPRRRVSSWRRMLRKSRCKAPEAGHVGVERGLLGSRSEGPGRGAVSAWLLRPPGRWSPEWPVAPPRRAREPPGTGTSPVPQTRPSHAAREWTGPVPSLSAPPLEGPTGHAQFPAQEPRGTRHTQATAAGWRHHRTGSSVSAQDAARGSAPSAQPWR